MTQIQLPTCTYPPNHKHTHTHTYTMQYQSFVQDIGLGGATNTIWAQISEGDYISRFSRAPAKQRSQQNFVRLRPHKNMCHHWAKQLENGSPSLLPSNHWPLKRTSMCYFLSLVHRSISTIAQLIWKGRGNYTHNKPAKIKTFENFIIKMFQQKVRNVNSTKFCTHTVTKHDKNTIGA